MLTFIEVLSRIESEIKMLQFPYPPKNLYDPIEYILSLGGKRIRPALAMLACNLYSDNIDPVIKAALGFELFHNFTLLHDDLMDHADMRRKKPTVHKVWSDNAAILSGDAMMITSYQLVCETAPQYLKQVLDIFTQTALEICGGQQYDMEFENRAEVTEAEYIEMIRLKTAVLLAGCLKVGAITGGASNEDAQNIYEFGINIGLAFQLQDDLLDVYGDSATFGKNIGGDILCNKKTFLLIHALEKASITQRDELDKWLECKEFNPEEKIKFFTNCYNELHIKELTTEQINAYYQKALIYLNKLNVEPKKLEELESVAFNLMKRNV